MANELRENVVLRVDGGMRTGRDVLVTAALGGDEYGFGTVSMIATGCIMARVCHTNNCPVGVASQREELRARFPGTPGDLVRIYCPLPIVYLYSTCFMHPSSPQILDFKISEEASDVGSQSCLSHAQLRCLNSVWLSSTGISFQVEHVPSSSSYWHQNHRSNQGFAL